MRYIMTLLFCGLATLGFADDTLYVRVVSSDANQAVIVFDPTFQGPRVPRELLNALPTELKLVDGVPRMKEGNELRVARLPGKYRKVSASGKWEEKTEAEKADADDLSAEQQSNYNKWTDLQLKAVVRVMMEWTGKTEGQAKAALKKALKDLERESQTRSP